MIKGAPLTDEKVLGRITQETNPYKIKQAESVFGNIDTSKIKTYEDASSAIQKSKIQDIAQQDKILEQYPETFKPSDLKKVVVGEGGSKASVNYVNESISDLKNIYKKSPDELVKIKDLETKFKTEGLTSKELNDLARQYGAEFGKKAFNAKTGEALTSRSAQDYESIRKGVKESATGTLPDNASRALDKQISSKITTQDMMDKMKKKVDTIQNKLENPSLFKKAGSLAGKAVDITTGGAVSKFLRSLLDYKPAKTLNALDIQNELQKNLSLLDKLDKMPIQQAYAEVVKLSATRAYYAGTIGKTDNQSQ